MSEKNKAKDEPEKITVKYVGEYPGAVVPGFFDGRGYYEKKGSQHTYKDPEEVQLAKELVETNPNFKEVEK